MKKTLVALAALAAVSAYAQSSVTLFGIADVGVTKQKQNGVSKTYMSSSGLSSSQIGFRGTEDLGGGMSASFWLEAGLQIDTGNGGQANNPVPAAQTNGLVFNRRSTVDLGGAWGAIRLGRDYTPTFWNHTVFDPFGTLGSGAGSNITLGGGSNAAAGANTGTASRTNNGISYLFGQPANASSAGLGSTGPYAQLTYALPENASGAVANGRYAGARVGYKMGPMNVALAYAKSTQTLFAATAAPIAGTSTRYTETNLGASYDLGVANLMGKIGTNKSASALTNDARFWTLGATVPVGAGYIPVSYGRVKESGGASPRANQFAIGYVHNLSKRTALYTTYSKIKNSNGGNFTFLGGNGGFGQLSGTPGAATAAGSGTGLDLGVRHTF